MTVQRVEVGDLFQDNDPRRVTPRIVRVIRKSEIVPRVLVRNEEHWDERLIGRETWISVARLANGRNRKTGYTRISR
jgi:hypothetical protein